MENAVLNMGLTQLIKCPTRVTRSTSSIIDHLYTTRPELIAEVNVANYCLSDHFPVLFTRTLKTKQVKGCHEHIKYRYFKHFNEEKFREDLLVSEFNSIEQIKEPEKGLCMLYDI